MRLGAIIRDNDSQIDSKILCKAQEHMLCMTIDRNGVKAAKIERMLPHPAQFKVSTPRRRLTCPIAVVRACTAMVHAAQMCLQSRFEVVSFGFSL